jgi:hypothetical protein
MFSVSKLSWFQFSAGFQFSCAAANNLPRFPRSLRKVPARNMTIAGRTHNAQLSNANYGCAAAQSGETASDMEGGGPSVPHLEGADPIMNTSVPPFAISL